MNHSHATAANTYLLLYPKGRLARLLREKPDAPLAVWNALKSIPTTALVAEGRVYGGGMHKIEPRELAKAPASTVLEAIDRFAGRASEQMTLF